MNLEPKLVELTTRGLTAVATLDAQRQLSNECIEMVLKKIDGLVANGLMTPDIALGQVHEIAAFRRIVSRQERAITQGRAAAQRQAEAS